MFFVVNALFNKVPNDERIATQQAMLWNTKAGIKKNLLVRQHKTY